MKATIFRSFTIVVEDKSLIVITKHIIEGTYKEEVEIVRSLFAEGKAEEAEEKKKQLLGFTPSATFVGGRKMEFFIEYSGYIVLDIDNLTPEQYSSAFAKAKSSPYTFCCFRSPGGNGFKIIAAVSTKEQHHELAYNQLADYFQQLTGVEIDRSGKDITRLCFMSYDPDGHKNINSEQFTVQIPDTVQQEKSNPEPQQKENTDHANHANYANQFRKCVEFTMQKHSYYDGNRNNFVHQLACNTNRAGISQDEALPLIQEQFNYDDKEVRSTVESAYKNNPQDFAKFAHFASAPQTKEEEQEEFAEQLSTTPLIPDSVFHTLPELLQQGCSAFSDKRERDIFFTVALTILSGCFTAISGMYDRRTVYPNLFCFVIAPAASGKGALTFAQQLAIVIHNFLLQSSKEQKQQYEQELEEYKTAKRVKKKGEAPTDEQPPQEPKFKVLFLPADSSTAALMSHLDQCDGCGIICETEADTMVKTFKQDWGGYSDLLRKSFQHERISSSRKTNHEYIQVQKPRLSVALSGTPSQVLGLISSAEDGLFSRFIFYAFKSRPEWRDVSPGNGTNLTTHFDLISQKVSDLASFLNKTEATFQLTPAQWQQLNQKFGTMLDEVSTFVSEDATSSVKRLGLVAFRIAMVLSILRNGEEGLVESSITCSDEDFNTALILSDVYLHHAMLMFKSLPKSSLSKLDPMKRKFFEALPADKEFSRAEAVAIGKQNNIKERTVDKYLGALFGSFLQEGSKYGCYRKK